MGFTGAGREEFLTQAKDLGSRLIKAFGSGDENLPYSGNVPARQRSPCRAFVFDDCEPLVQM